ncbi:MAG: hypothetical protein Q9181_004035 [Wetmoreana brouardii]
MARTRAQGRKETKGEPIKQAKPSKPTMKKRSRSEIESGTKETGGQEAKSSASKKQKFQVPESVEDSVKPKADAFISKYGILTLSELSLSDPSASNPENVLALVYNAMLTSARISHELAYKSVKCLVEAGYQDIAKLDKSTWEERTEILTEGGYTRYREKTATALGELAELIQKEYDGDLNNLLKKADSRPDKVRKLLKEIKGIGNVGVDIFCDTAQEIWPCLAPFIDPRSMKTAEQCGLGGNMDKIWEAVGKDPGQMCRLASALTTVRLEKKEHEFSGSFYQPKGGIMDAVKQTIAQNVGLGGAAHQAVPESQQFSLEQVPSLTGKVAIITGGSQGIGYGCSHTMLKHDIKKLFILSTSKDVVDGAVNAVKEEMGQEAADKVQWLHCDLSDWVAVKAAADRIASQTDRIDIMINNAGRGIMTYQTTEYGVDRHMALNHFGHVILNSHLMPIMKKTASDGNKVRIVTLSSNAHQGAPKETKFESLDELNQDLGPNGQYGRSKLANLLYARYLARHLTQGDNPNILANATHPGFVDTKMSKEDIHEPYPLGGYAMSVGMAPLKKDIFMGCVSTMFAATKTSESGQYICPPAVPESGTELSQDAELGEQLMKLTREVVKEKTYDDSAKRGCPFSFY